MAQEIDKVARIRGKASEFATAVAQAHMAHHEELVELGGKCYRVLCTLRSANPVVSRTRLKPHKRLETPR